MKFNESNIFVFIAAIIIGVLISLNIHLGATNNRVVLNSKQYQDAYNNKNKLALELSNLKEMYYKNTSKLNDYKYTSDRNSKVIDNISEELEMNKAILGYSKVKGEGLKITIIDSSNVFNKTEGNASSLKIMHNYDMINVVNQLRAAGAEAISINGQRITTNSAIYCYWAFLNINKVKTPAPFYLNVVGNKEVLKKQVSDSNGYIKYLINRGINVEIIEGDAITIPEYTGHIEIKDLKQDNK